MLQIKLWIKKLILIKNENDLKIRMPILGRKIYLASKSPDFGWFVENEFCLAYYIDNKLGFKRMIFSTEVVSLNNDISKEEEKNFLDGLILYVKKNNICDFIYKAQGNVVFKSCPSHATCIPWGTYEVSLEKSEEELFKSFSGKSRNVIRRAIKEDVNIMLTDNIGEVYKNIKDMFDRQNSFHSPAFSYLEYLKNNLPDNVAFFVAKKDLEVQGSLILVYDELKGYAMYAGSIPSPKTGSLDLLHFEAMKYLQSKGVLIYDFVGTRLNIVPGSKQAGIDRFKRKFNPVLREGYAFKVIINPFKHNIFEIIVWLYFKMKGYSYTEAIEQIRADEKLIQKD